MTDRVGGRASVLAILVVLVIGVAAVLAACGSPAGTSPVPASAVTGSTPASTPTASFPDSPVDGVILSVDASSLTDVRGFTLLTRDGQRIAFTLGTLEDPTAFPPGHLAEHQATSEPVWVSFHVENGLPVVYRLGDASPASPAAT